MRLLVPEEMPISLLPEPEGGRLELSFDLALDVDDLESIHDVDAWRVLRRFEPEPECYCQRD
jgi:hypothetical protein